VIVEPKTIGIVAIMNNRYAMRSTQFEWQTDPFHSHFHKTMPSL